MLRRKDLVRLYKENALCECGHSGHTHRYWDKRRNWEATDAYQSMSNLLLFYYSSECGIKTCRCDSFDLITNLKFIELVGDRK